MKKLSLYISSLLLLLISFVGCHSDSYNFDDLPVSVKSYFTYTTGKLLINQPITFTNESEYGESYFWDFGDGTTSIEKSPIKQYTAGGSYVVKLKVVGEGGTGNYSKNIVVIDPDAVVLSDKILYYIEDGDKTLLKKVSVNPGSTAEIVLDITDMYSLDMACDTVSGKIFLADTDNGKIWRMNMNGSGLETIASGFADPFSIVVDHRAKKLYWSNTDGTIAKSNFDGSDLVRELVKIDGGDIRGLAVNSKTGDLYFMDYESEVLFKSKSDGSGIQELDNNAYGFSIFVDEVNDKIYYDSRSKRGIMRANLDGTNASLFINTGSTSSYRVYGINIDYEQEKIYWSQYYTDDIMRMNLDGTKKETVVSGVDTPRGIFLK